MIEISEQEFNQLQLQKKVKSHKKNEPAPPPPPKEKPADITKLVSDLTQSISKLAKDDPDNSLIKSLIKIQEEQQKVLAAMTKKTPQKDWEFSVVRSQSGRISKILAREV